MLRFYSLLRTKYDVALVLALAAHPRVSLMGLPHIVLTSSAQWATFQAFCQRVVDYLALLGVDNLSETGQGLRRLKQKGKGHPSMLCTMYTLEN